MIQAITTQELAKRVEQAYANMGELAMSLKGMAFLNGCLCACDTVSEIITTRAQHPENEGLASLDEATLKYILTFLTQCAMNAANGVVIMERLEEGPEETMPTGMKPN